VDCSLVAIPPAARREDRRLDKKGVSAEELPLRSGLILLCRAAQQMTVMTAKRLPLHRRKSSQTAEQYRCRGGSSGGIPEGAPSKTVLSVALRFAIHERPRAIWRPLERGLPGNGNGLGRLGYAKGVVLIRRWIGKGYSVHHCCALTRAWRSVRLLLRHQWNRRTIGRAASVPHFSLRSLQPTTAIQ
jgi:hypothetical protein